jgi:tetratricopeptide (TPR) repeat protein
MGFRGDLDAWYNKGYALFELGKFDEALRAIETALGIDPSDIKSWALKGTVLMAVERFDQAIDAFDHVLTRCTDDAESWVNRGGALHEAGRYGEAVNSCRQALRLSPDHYLAGMYLGVAETELKNQSES